MPTAFRIGMYHDHRNSHRHADANGRRHGTRRWLRGPRVVLVDETGGVSTVGVNWSHDDFARLTHAMDCMTYDHLYGKSTRCGEPMADMRDILDSWPAERVPRELNTYLAKAVRVRTSP